ncbi:hypothetical protein QH494_13920 [Sphingomonas sp. AR_OL41]|uniref:hypothetical protein n=1 Tax=Sphingomonas sp. AR_OL41 TaxID=3042729 RepID=UPI002480A18D|nr:hypothetical protein [Sphingomonas sp. AR_OL41]MDH7973282.1 hypothetical protein [Sphingomonas sp. AR_OL41]
MAEYLVQAACGELTCHWHDFWRAGQHPLSCYKLLVDLHLSKMKNLGVVGL